MYTKSCSDDTNPEKVELKFFCPIPYILLEQSVHLLTRSQHLYMIRFLLPALLLTLLVSCTDKPDHQNNARAFYYWQTTLSSFDWNDSLYRAANPSKIYYRFFDVDWSPEAQAPVPLSPLRADYTNWMPQRANVPVVFITNETFKNLDRDKSVLLAWQVYRKVMMQLSSVMANNEYVNYYTHDDEYEYEEPTPYQVRSENFNELARHDSLYDARMKLFTEIQFDCDWTKTTRENYFTFLEEAKKLFNKQLVTSTIRLYQYKYPKEAGVPPVTRGMLMCYNAGDIRDTETRNSIFDKDEIMSYLKGSDYPLPLDYALPVFQWALLFRDNTLTAILPASVVKNYESHLSTTDHLNFTVKEEFVHGYTDDGIFIRKGNTLRLESPDLEDVKDIAAWLGDHKNNPEAILTLYHLNTYDLTTHAKDIEAVFNSF